MNSSNTTTAIVFLFVYAPACLPCPFANKILILKKIKKLLPRLADNENIATKEIKLEAYY